MKKVRVKIKYTIQKSCTAFCFRYFRFYEFVVAHREFICALTIYISMPRNLHVMMENRLYVKLIATI